MHFNIFINRINDIFKENHSAISNGRRNMTYPYFEYDRDGLAEKEDEVICLVNSSGYSTEISTGIYDGHWEDVFKWVKKSLVSNRIYLPN